MTRLTNASYVKIGLLVLLAIVICGGIVSCSNRCAAGPAFMGRIHDTYNGVTARESGAGSVAAADVKNIAISWAAGSATITVCDDAETNGQITFTETGQGTRVQPLRWGCENGTLVISYALYDSLVGCSNFGSKNLEVKIPRSIAQKLERFDLDTASGDYKIDGITCQTMGLGVASGSVESINVSAQQLKVDLASGRIAATGDFPAAVDLHVASGTIDITSNTCPTSSKLDMASGNVSFALPAQSVFEVDYDALSGNVDSEFLMRGGSASAGSPKSGQSTVYGDAGTEVAGRFDVDMASGHLAFRMAK